MPYAIHETPGFQKDLEDLAAVFRARIEKKLRTYIYPQLRESPHAGSNIRKLVNYEPDTWRYRIGPWRVFYQIDERKHIVYMTTLQDRKDAYD